MLWILGYVTGMSLKCGEIFPLCFVSDVNQNNFFTEVSFNSKFGSTMKKSHSWHFFIVAKGKTQFCGYTPSSLPLWAPVLSEALQNM